MNNGQFKTGTRGQEPDTRRSSDAGCQIGSGPGIDPEIELIRDSLKCQIFVLSYAP